MNSGLNDPARAYSHKADDSKEAFRDLARFAPADNLYDAIRADVEAIGGIEFIPLIRDSSREPPFNDIDWIPDSE